ncbi:16S rRNA (cytidine(1402)-2'-O)-methyltransferase [Oceanicola sp. 502str15]|uniref:16S rRNA (cytidine(1402)-2'-O)-methyltransferase n=1 Tax=Oceanicola sp. 502str15 TaxID=2696061 RepID=UPI0020965D08|nr:16S rRNA (cytidine(1402)-2'-O)-methyltransferase [Oceanicola sp. 502str15]MCO6384563.1 16S rRNA (cytidine(1402)-2'-O)-methyltransferase [Oceanicola sp. 502str15]
MSEPTGGPAWRKTPLSAGLYFVATPIGSARDITLRGLDILASAEVIAAEDTRTARKLLELHGVPLAGRRLIAYHDHSSPAARNGVLKLAAEGASVAYVSEAGSPLVADPGYALGRDAAAQGISVTTAPGPSAAIAALTLSGLPSDRFTFVGFPPSSGGARKQFVAEVSRFGSTVILFESPKRISALLGLLCESAGEDRPAALARELTKKFEEVRRGSLAELSASVADDPPRGEIVLVMSGAVAGEADPEVVDAALGEALSRLRVKDAAAEVAAALGRPKREMYQRALELSRATGDD